MKGEEKYLDGEESRIDLEERETDEERQAGFLNAYFVMPLRID